MSDPSSRDSDLIVGDFRVLAMPSQPQEWALKGRREEGPGSPPGGPRITGVVYEVVAPEGAYVRTHPSGLVRGVLSPGELFVRVGKPEVGPGRAAWIWGYALGNVQMSGWMLVRGKVKRKAAEDSTSQPTIVKKTFLKRKNARRRIPAAVKTQYKLNEKFRILYLNSTMRTERKLTTWTTSVNINRGPSGDRQIHVYKNYTRARTLTGSIQVDSTITQLKWRYTFDSNVIVVFFKKKWRFAKLSDIDASGIPEDFRRKNSNSDSKRF